MTAIPWQRPPIEARLAAAGHRALLELAHKRTRNSWEVVSGMARRLPRVYHAAAGPVGLRALSERS